jgi:7SK snRNA methylphosphate capping enzyme
MSLSAPKAVEGLGTFSKKRKHEELHEVLEPNRKFNYFPASCEHMFGPLPITSGGAEKHEFPLNVSFRTADWLKNEIPEDEEGYDVVVA